jgi:hypothetical protein
MKLRKVLAAASAFAVATSAVAVSASAAFSGVEETDVGGPADGVQFVCTSSNDYHTPVLSDASLATEIKTVVLTLKCKSKDFESEITAGDTWYGGGYGFNNKSKGWTSLGEWNIQDGVGDSQLVKTDTRYVYQLTFAVPDGTFTANEEYGFFWIQDWAKSYDFEITGIDLLNADGVDVRNAGAASDTTATEDKTEDTTAEDTTATDDKTDDTDVTVSDEDEDTDVVVIIEDDDDDEDEDADEDDGAYTEAGDPNDYFDGSVVYLVTDDGTPAYLDDADIDLTDIYGVIFKGTFSDDEIADEETWIGGGIGPNSNSTGWTYTEWGRTEKPIAIDYDNGTVAWLSDSPIFQDDEEYAQLFVQTWGGTVSFEEVALLGADGEIIAGSDLEYAPNPVDEADDADDTAADSTTSADKGSPDTGVEGVAAVAGIAALAAGALLISKKRK